MQIGLRRGEETGDGSGELGLRYDRPKLAVGYGVSGAPNPEAKRGRAARHCLQEGDPESIARRRHDEQVSHAVHLYKISQPDGTEETHTPAYAYITRKLFEGGSVVTLPDNQILHVMALRDNIRNGGNDSVLAFVALARVHPRDGQEHALVLQRQRSARCRAVSRREHFLDFGTTKTRSGAIAAQESTAARVYRETHNTRSAASGAAR